MCEALIVKDVFGKTSMVFNWQKIDPNMEAGDKLQEAEKWNGRELQKDLEFLIG